MNRLRSENFSKKLCKKKKTSEMPGHLISDTHELMNETSTNCIHMLQIFAHKTCQFELK